MRAKKLALVAVVGDLNIFSVLLIIISFFPTPGFIEQIGFSFTPIRGIAECIFRILEVIILLIITYGFLKLKKWGYWSMITYNLFFLIASILLHNRQFAPFFIPSLLALNITFPCKRYFYKEIQTS